MATTTHVGLTLMTAAQARPDVEYNAMLAVLDEALSDINVKAQVTTANNTSTVCGVFSTVTDTAYIVNERLWCAKAGGVSYAGYHFEGLIVNDGGVVSAITSQGIIDPGYQSAGFGVTLDWHINGVNVQISVTGLAGVTINWFTHLRINTFSF